MAYESNLQGIKFRPAHVRERIAELEAGTTLRLDREPTNQFDRNAIRVLDDDGEFLGYIERGIARELAGKLDAGDFEFTCYIKTAGEVPLLRIEEL